jgi:hypothetical protein
VIFEFQDSKNWSYRFELDEDDLSCVLVESTTEEGHRVHREYVAFCEDVFSWQDWHTRKDKPLISEEARQFCERSIYSFMKMKAFW